MNFYCHVYLLESRHNLNVLAKDCPLPNPWGPKAMGMGGNATPNLSCWYREAAGASCVGFRTTAMSQNMF